MKISYRFKLVFVITSLSVLLTAASVFIYYQYTYNIMMDSISKNLKDVAEISRSIMSESDIERLQRLKQQMDPYIKYTPDEIAFLKTGGIANNFPKEAVARLQKSEDFQVIVKKLRSLMLLTINGPYAEKKIYDNKKLIEYCDKGGIMPYIVFISDRYKKDKIVQNIVSFAYEPLENIWPGNTIGTSWHTLMAKERADDPDVYVHDELYDDIFYTALFSSSALVDKNGQVVAYLQMDYPAGHEINKLHNLRVLSYILVLLSFALSFGLALYVSKRMNASLRKLTDATEQIKDNNYDVRADITNEDEFGKLGNAFNSMAEAVKKTTTDLQKSNERLMSLTADMHDGVGAVLTSIQIATRKDSSTDIASLHSLAEQGMGEIRFLMDAMEYESSTFELLTEGIALIAVDILQPRKIEWTLETEGDGAVEIPFQMYLDIQRIAREVFANIIKHSDAKKCSIRLMIADGEIGLRVSDNGHELEKPLGTSGGKGLKNIRHRVLRYVGTFESGRTDSGFYVDIKVKIPV